MAIIERKRIEIKHEKKHIYFAHFVHQLTGLLNFMIYNGKAQITSSIDQISISVPSRKNWFGLIFCTAWLGGWFFALIKVTSILFMGLGSGFAIGFLTFWLIAWIAGGIAITGILLWGYFGKEKFSLDHGMVLFEKTVFGYGKIKDLRADEISNIRFVPVNDHVFGAIRSIGLSYGAGKVKFDHGMKTYAFGLGVDDAEATHIAALLKEHFTN